MARRRNSNSGVYSKKDYMNRQENKGVYSRDDYMRQRETRIDPARVNDIQEGAEALRLDIMRRQQSQAMTNAWQNMSQQATYSPAGDQRGLAYAEKMKYDTMGRDAYLQDLENQRRNQQTYMTQRQPVEELQAEKRWSKEQARREQEQKEWDAYVQAQYNTSHDAMRDIKKETGGSSTGAPLTIKDFQEWRARQQVDRESGALDKGNDPWNVSDKGLPDWIKRNQKAAEEYSKTPGQLWADVRSYADEVEAGRLRRSKPAGYDDNTRDAYDKELYNAINGEGAYEKKVDEAYEWPTDEKIDALDAELDELWAQYERGELPEFESFYNHDDETEKRIADLTNNRDKNREQYTDAGDKFFDFGTDYNDWASMTPEKRRETLWMEMMGTDYAAAQEGMTDAQKAEMNRRMDLIMDKAMQGKTKDFNAAANAYSNLVKQGKTVQEYRDKIKDLDIQAEGLEAQGYTGADVPVMLEANKPKYVSDPEDTEGMLRLDRIWSNTEKAMYLMNYKKNLDGTGDLYSDANKYMFANEDQIKQANIFYEYDQKNGTHMTEAFLEGIDSYLTSELAKYQEEYARSLADDAFRGSVARVASYAAKPITGLLGTAGTILNTLGVEGAQDTTGDFFKYDKLINVLREQQNTNAADWTAKTFGEEWRDRTTFVLGVVDSIADNLMAMAMGSKMAGVSAATRTEQNVERSMRLVQLIMSAEATSATMIEKLDSGMDGTEAAVYSVGDGIIEWLTERYSLEQILKPDVKAMLGKPKQLISFLVKSSTAEGSEEIASDLLNLGLDSVVSYIAGHEDEIRQRVNDYIVNEHMTAREAEKRVLKEKLGEIAQSGLAGALSGLGMAGGRTVANKFNQVQTGRNVRAEENGLQKIIDLAKGMEEGTESRALAEKLAGQKKVSNGQLGRLSQLIITESSEERGEVIRGTVYRNVAEDLKAAGVENVSEAAEIITRNLTEGNEKLSRADMKVLAQSEGAINVWKDYNTTESLSNAKTKLDIASRTQNINSVMEQAEDLSSPIRTATGKLSQDIMRSVKSTASAAEAIDDFQQRRSWLMSESYAQLAKDLLESDKSTQKSTNYLDDVMKIRLAGMTLAKEMPQTQLENAAARALFNAAREEFNEADKGRLRNQVQVIPGKGTAAILGAQYGTDAWDDKLNELKVTRDQRQQLKAMAEIAVRMGNKLDVFNDADRTDVYGFEDSTGTIHVNLAGLNGNKLSHHMLVTMSHELTHWLEQNSWEGYNQLRSFILDSLRSKGESIEDMIIDAINNQNKAVGAKSGQALQITDAMKEIVAKSCENLLSSKAMEAELRKTNPELHGKIRNFVKKFVARLRAAVQGMTGSLSKAARTLYNETEEIARLWLGARQEALSRTATGPLAEAGPEGVSFSTAEIQDMSAEEMDSAYMQAVESGDMETAQQFVNEAAERAMKDSKLRMPDGKLRKLYHGTNSGKFTVFNKSYIASASGDSGFFGKGFYFAYSKEEAHYYGRNIMEVFLDIKNPFNIRDEFYKLNGTESPDYNASRAVFVVNFAEKFPELANEHFVTVFKKGADTGDRISLKQFADEYKKIVDSKKFDVSKLDNDGETEWLVTADMHTESYTNEEGETFSWPEYGYQKRFYMEKDARNQLTNAYEYMANVVYDSISMQNPTIIILETELTDALINRGYDGVIQSTNGDEAVAFYESQIKLADPVTYDDAGNVIPLSERFQADNADIRYSTADDAEDRQIKLQVNSHIDELMKLEPVADISSNIDLSKYYENGARSISAAYKAWANDLMKKFNYQVNRENFGTVEITKSRIRTGFGYAMNNKAKAAFAAVPDIIQKGELINEHENHKGNAEIQSATLAGKIMLDGKPQIMAVVVTYTKDTHRYKTHKVFMPDGTVLTIEKEASARNAEDVKSQGLPIRYASNDNITQEADESKRYSTAELDEEYSKAVSSGDTARQQELVDQAARDNGYTLKVYHGTPTGGFTQFKDWSYFTEKKEYADRYNHPSASNIRGYAVESSQPMTYALYMNPGRVFDTRNKKVAVLYNKARMEYGMGELTDNGLPDWTDGRDIIDYIEENELPYDTIILNEGADGGYGAPVVSRGVSYVTRANMVKSAEPITRDNNGNVVPLSERFNKQENDIRFSIAEPVEQRADGLIAVHNLSADNLLKSIKLGGFAMPSIAIVKADNAYDKYGNISVIFYPGTIDPQAISKNKVYGGDAWTPIYPKTEYKINSRKLSKITDKIRDLLPERFKNNANMVDFAEVNLSDTINSNGGAEGLAKRIGSLGTRYLQLAYMQDTGKEINFPMKTADLDNTHKFDNEEVIHIAETLGRDLIEEANQGETTDYLRAHNELVEEIRQELNKFYESNLPEDYPPFARRLLRKGRYNENNYGFWQADEMLKAAGRYYSKGMTETIDMDAMDKQLQEQIDEDDYNKWVDNLFSGIIEKSGLRNNKDYYTNTGNPRSWDALHDEETLDNVVRIMREQADKGGNAFFGQSALMALGTKDFKSLEDIRAHKDQLKHLTEEDYDNLKESVINGFQELMVQLADPKESNLFIAQDRVLNAIVDAVKTSRTASGIQKVMKQWRYNISTEQAQKIVDLMENISNLPTDYFEAKPQRAVGLDEIAKVVLPADADTQLITALEQNGIDYETYDGTDADRLEKVNSIEGVQFSTQESPDMEVNNFMMGLQEFNMPTNQEKTMLRQYKDLHMSMGITQMKIQDYEKKLRELRAIENPSVYDRDQIRITEQRIDTNKKRLVRLRNDMVRATKDKGYARQMMKNDSLMKNLVNGVTADQMITVVQNMMKQLEELNSEMQERAKKLQELGENATVLQIRQQFNRQGLKRIAAQLKEQMNSEADNREIENRLALIALKMKEGKFDKETTEELVDMILGNMRGGLDTYVLSTLRGERIALSPAQLKELKAKNSGIRELNAQLAGTGIMFTASGTTNLEHKWADLCDKFTSLNRKENNLEMVDKLMKLINDEQQAVFEERFTNANIQGTTETVLKAAAQLVPEIVTDAKSLNLIKETMQYAAQVAEQAKGTAAEVFDIDKAVERIKNTGRKVESTASTLTGDLKTAMAYFNDLSEQSEAALWKRERLALIDQLKSENTMELLVEREKWRQKIEKDQKAREQMQSNMHLRKQIHTNFTRLRKLLINETDQKNIPEHMKGLAREMLGLITDNDLSGRKLTGMDPKDLLETRRVLDAMRQLDGDFTPDDLRLINDEEAQAAVLDALADIEDGIGFYNNKLGKDIIVNLQGLHNALEKISDGVSVISSVISAERSISFLNRRMDIADAAEDVKRGMANSRFKGELAGRGRKAIDATKSAVFYGNMTPVYYFKMLRNGGMDAIWEDIQEGENRNGLETAKAKVFLEQLAEKTGYKDWAEEKKEVILGGRKVSVTIDNMMELYAIWQREHTTNPEMSQHLAKGGVYIQDEEEDTGRLRRERKEQRPIRVTDEEIGAIYGQLTDQQKEYMESIVRYLSNDMSELGNKASMRMYGIKKYKETYYFPMKVWDGVKSARSDKGITGTDENRMAHKSWSKRRMHNAQNALVIGSFTKDAVNHIVEMINYNTMAPGIENMNKILNYQFTEGMEEEETKRNLRVMFQEAYGREALKYLETFMKDMNGGVAQDQRKTLRDRALTIFKKNAVAGSLSVVLQQPLSYIRAAMIINPKYMATAPVRENWKDSYREMMAHSGVAVIKDMGRFDMNFGQSAKDFITPETRKSALEKISDATTIAPQLADRMTWIWMWNAVKAEQAAQHKGMDVKSDKFLDIVGKRFNQVMRETQVYDSILVKSSNMRSQNFGMKLITSFMAEPTLSLNVLADAVGRVKAGDEKAKTHLAKAGATFMLSAILQAVFKGLMGSGRTPDEKKTWLENFLNKFEYNLINEANPISLIPGYSDLIEVLKTGELKDDAMGAIGKLLSIVQTTQKAIQGKGKGWYRDIEDTAAQLAQLFTNIPAKNLMRDARAVFNLIFQGNYAKRPTSGAVRKYQLEANIFNADSILGTVNTWLGDAGFKTSNKAYYSRMYEAQKAGNQAEADSIREYLTLAKGVEEETIQSGLRSLAKNDNSLSAEERIKVYADNSTDKGGSNFIIAQLKAGEITDLQARKMIKEIFPEKTDDDIYWQVDRAKYQADTGKKVGSDAYYYRLEDAINANRANQIQEAVNDLLKHGVTKDKIKKKLSDWKSEYLAADSNGRIRIKDAITKAYKAAGYSAADAQKTIDGWINKKTGGTKKTETKKTETKKQTENRDTTGQWGRGNINLNKRQVVHNSDGSISTERSFSVNIDGKEVLLPTVINGKIVSEEEAIRHYEETGEYLGKFNTVKEAEEYAEKLHERQDWYYNRK